MIDAPLALAFTAGLVATVNPCGFAMLPAYLSWYIGVEGGPADQPATPRHPPGRALVVGATESVGFLVVFVATESVGFLVVFVATEAIVTASVRSFIDYVPWVAMIIGVALVGLGVALLAGREITVALPKPHADTRTRQLRSMIAFGASYAVASLSCTLPVFLVVVASTFTRSDIASGMVTFAVYAAGMSVVLLTVTVAVAVAHHSLVRRIRSFARHLNRVAGGLLVVAGGYIVYYWAFNLGTDPGQTTGAGHARFVEGLSADATGWFQTLGWPRTLVLFGGFIATAATIALLGRRPAPPRTAAPAAEDLALAAAPTVIER